MKIVNFSAFVSIARRYNPKVDIFGVLFLLSFFMHFSTASAYVSVSKAITDD